MRTLGNAVAAVAVQGRADRRMTLDTIAQNAGPGFLPMQAEHCDFILARGRSNRKGVVAFGELLWQSSTREVPEHLGLQA